MVKRREIPRFLESEVFLDAFSVWKRWTRYGFYNGGGRSDQPGEIIRILDIFEDEKAFCEAEKYEEIKRKNGGNH